MTKDEQAAVGAAEATTMEEVRSEIDRIDRLLVRLLAERQGYIAAAGRIKTRRETVRDPWRIEDVVAKVLAAAEREGLSKRIAEPVWRELIEQCIAYEDEVFLLQQAPQKAKKVS